MKKTIIVLFLLLIACTRQIPVETGPPIEAYFCERDNCTALLTNLLANAKTAQCALYDVSLPQIQGTLTNIDFITDDNKGPLMHNKFCIINKSVVWTGSWNPTKTTKANNVVIISSKALAENYADEFTELPGGKARVQYPKIVYNGNRIENYFCPEDQCKKHLLKELEAAQQNITFMLASFTDEDVMKLLREKSKTINVQGIVDKAQKKAIEALQFVKTGSVHHKVFIIDDKTVITGSYNPTKNGDNYNDENMLIIDDSTIAEKFLEEFHYLIN